MKMLETSDSMIDFKVRSKLYLSHKEAVSHVQDDISKKIPAVLPDYKKGEKNPPKMVSLVNPAFTVTNELTQQLLERFGAGAEFWDETCCSTIFLAESSPDEDEEHQRLPQIWMFKYEIFFVEDMIELIKNGEYAFNPMNLPTLSYNSTYQ